MKEPQGVLKKQGFNTRVPDMMRFTSNSRVAEKEAVILSHVKEAVTDRLTRLETQGLIVREPCPSDGRSMLAKLSPKGSALITKAFAEDMAIEEKMLAPLSARERKTLAALLAKLLRRLEQT